MNLLLMAAAAGIWPALPFSGEWLFRLCGVDLRDHNFSGYTRLSLRFVAGMALWSPPMAIAAAIGVYSGAAFGLVGWGLAAWGTVRLLHRRRPAPAAPSELQDWLIPVLLVVAGVLAFAYPSESIVGGRDMGVYANHGIYIAHHGRLDIAYPWSGLNDTSLASVYQSIPALYGEGGTLTFQFAHLFPIWLAQTHAGFGFEGLIRFNALLAILFIPIFFDVVRLIVPAPIAMASVCLVALNPGEIWLARVTLSEVFTQTLIWAGVLLFLGSLIRNDRGMAYPAGLILGLALWVRVDAFLLIPIVLSSHSMFMLIENENGEQKLGIWLALYRTALPMFLLAGAYDVIYSTLYVGELSNQLGKINYVMIASALILFAVQRWAPVLRRVVRHRVFMLTAISLLAGFGLYAYFVRPVLQPFSIIPSVAHLPDNGLANTRDHREDSLVNLGAYVSPLVLLLGIGGVAATLFAARKRSGTSVLALPLALLGCFGAVYIWNPSIAPDHFWWIRRFIPVVIPCLGLFAAFCVQEIVARFKGPFATIMLSGAGIYLVVFLVNADAFVMTKSENSGYYGQLQRLAGKLPEHELVLSHDASVWATWETPLYVAFDRKMVPTDIDSGAITRVVRKWIRQRTAAGKLVYLVYEGNNPLKGFQVASRDSVTLSRSFIEPEVVPLPRLMMIEERHLRIYTISALAANFDDMNLGSEQVFGVEESGFYDREASGTIARRWTNGSATLIVPVDSAHVPNALRIDIESTGPKGTRLRIIANDILLVDRQVPAGMWSNVLPLDHVPVKDSLVIALISDTFVPSRQGPGYDSRLLGVSVSDIRLLERYHPFTPAPLPATAYASRLDVGFQGDISAIPGNGILPVTISIVNRSSSPWPSNADLVGEKGAVRIGIRWVAPNTTGPSLAEQRADLPHAMYPGDRVDVSAELRPVDAAGKRLKPGQYHVLIGLVQEGVSWFFEKGDTLVRRNAYIKQ